MVALAFGVGVAVGVATAVGVAVAFAAGVTVALAVAAAVGVAWGVVFVPDGVVLGILLSVLVTSSMVGALVKPLTVTTVKLCFASFPWAMSVKSIGSFGVSEYFFVSRSRMFCWTVASIVVFRRIQTVFLGGKLLFWPSTTCGSSRCNGPRSAFTSLALLTAVCGINSMLEPPAKSMPTLSPNMASEMAPGMMTSSEIIKNT